MRSTPATAVVGACIALASCSSPTSTTEPERQHQPNVEVAAKPAHTHTLSSWNDVALASNTSPKLVIPNSGASVLARWKLPTVLSYREATVVSANSEFCTVRYLDGSRGRVPTRAILVKRTLEPGDLVYHRGRAKIFVHAASTGTAIVHPVDNSANKTTVRRDQLRVVLRTDRNLAPWIDAANHKVGDRVLAKWDVRAWWVGRVVAVQGEALRIRYDDGSNKWIPRNHAIRFSRLRPGLPVVGINKRDGQPVPATLLSTTATSATLRFFDGTTRSLPLGKVAAYVDQVGLDYSDPCKTTAPDTRVLAKTLRAWLTKQIHFYTVAPRPAVRTSPTRIELGFAMYLPSDRIPRKNWQRLMTVLAKQVKTFIEAELSGVTVNAWVYNKPIVGDRPLSWLKANLREAHAWHVWQPTGQSVRRVFPDGPKQGRHRVVVVVPDAPGISSDSSGVERHMGFVRARGGFFAKITELGLDGVTNKTVAKTSFDQWHENYLATTLAHEALHTIGLPHTDGDPWSAMNIGPWYPITRPDVHIAKHHKLVLRSPFTSQALSQGYAHFLMQNTGGYLDVIATSQRLDTTQKIYYAHGPGHFRLTQTLLAFATKRRLHRGARLHTGERAIVRAYLASLIHFVADVYGTNSLRQVFTATTSLAETALAKAAGVTVHELQRRWHQWLDLQLQRRAHK